MPYKFGTSHGETRTGYLLCDTSKVDPAILRNGIHVLRDDGTDLIVGVIQTGDRFHIVTGRLASSEASK